MHRQGCQNNLLNRLLNKLLGQHFETFVDSLAPQNPTMICFDCFNLNRDFLIVKNS